jgi:hypothetical protein
VGGIEMTHEYIIALGGRVHAPPGTQADPEPATAIAWAADHVLAVGTDDVVRGISRGDSIFLDLDGCEVTAAGIAAGLEVGSPADLDFWDAARIVARVRAGAFTKGDEHCGPFRRI